MTKLHQLLAVERDLQNSTSKLINELAKKFPKDSLFSGFSRKLHHFSESDKHLDQEERQTLTTTVIENINYIQPHWVKWIDLIAQKDLSNMDAKANIQLGGKDLVKDVPATTLLTLSQKLTALRDCFEKIPTLEPGTAWDPDKDSEMSGAYIEDKPEIRLKEVRDREFRIVAEATEHHKAQVEGVDILKAVGRYETIRFSGKMTPFDKAEILTRVDILITEVKSALTRANSAAAKDFKIGEKLFGYIVTGKTK